MSLTKFSLAQEKHIQEYYDSYGYVIVENLLNSFNIERFFKYYNQIKYSKFFVFFSQDTHIPRRPKLTPEGFIENSMLNPADLKLWSNFSQSLEQCLVDENVTGVLSLLSGSLSHVMMQNMFFDKSTGTIEHQDHYYLDSDPPGKMIAAWYALEDIHEDAGCFFVLPGSHKGRVIEREQASNFSDHHFFVKAIKALIENDRYEYQKFPLNKGDVLFWHPYTIHGAYKNSNPNFSRKSLTAHYYPSHLKSLYGKTLPKFRKSVNPQVIIQSNKLGHHVSNAMLYLKAIIVAEISYQFKWFRSQI
jgi:phytanoyl-CoA hydroxylase